MGLVKTHIILQKRSLRLYQKYYQLSVCSVKLKKKAKIVVEV